MTPEQPRSSPDQRRTFNDGMDTWQVKNSQLTTTHSTPGLVLNVVYIYVLKILNLIYLSTGATLVVVIYYPHDFGDGTANWR